mmetsp:Transcript_9511/g.13498  ORF Transcript_9511/g.13498 Transcript_9511/m.13498 type:complete len:157 (-) Transcript_9511:65-535(-)
MSLRQFSVTLGRLASKTLSVTPLWNANGATRLMSRTSGANRAKKHKKFLKEYAKGYRGRSKNCYSIAIRRVHRAWQYAYRDRKVKRREWRKLWITRISAGSRQYNWSYSRFIPACNRSNIQLNRKILANLAGQEPFAFKAIVDVIGQEDTKNQASL